MEKGEFGSLEKERTTEPWKWNYCSFFELKWWLIR